MRALLILNPAAGRGRRRATVSRILRILAAGGYEVEVAPTTAPGHATELARQAAESGAGALFAMGGDGTLREVAAGALGTGVPVGFLPAGTVDVMVRPLGLPHRTVPTAAALCAARPRQMDVGLCGETPFLMMASCGFDAFVISRLRPALKRRLGKLGVALTTLVAALAFDFPEIELEVDGRRLRVGFASVCNIPHYGGPWRLIPGARPDDRRLDLLVLRGRGRWATATFALALHLGRHLRRADVEVFPVRESVEIRGPAKLPVQIDGDVYPSPPPLSIRLSARRRTVLARSCPSPRPRAAPSPGRRAPPPRSPSPPSR